MVVVRKRSQAIRVDLLTKLFYYMKIHNIRLLWTTTIITQKNHTLVVPREGRKPLE